jgi:translation elongation factor EF-1alpha
MLVKTAGVKHMVVLVNKMDDPTVNWDEERQVPSYCSVLALNSFWFPTFL